MNYKEKYKRALERCKEEFNFNNLAYSHEEIKQKLKRVFPELEESEEERVKNEIIAFVEQSIHRGGGTPIPQEQENRWLAWLEKQGELKPIFRVGDYIRNKKTKDRVLIEQIDIANKVYCYVSRDDAAEIHSDFRFSEQNDWEIIGQKIVEQKTAEWNEEDEIMIKCCFRALNFLENFGKKECSSHWHSNHFVFDKIVYPEQVECWLKSLKQRMKNKI